MGKLVTQILGERSVRDRKGNLMVVKPSTLVDLSRYTGEKLRDIRAKNGVGRPPKK